jgi:Tfp pilus assembly protein PilF
VRIQYLSLLLILLLLSIWCDCFGQRRPTPPARAAGGFTLFGDVEISGTENSEIKIVTFDLLLYARSGTLLDRQKVGSKGRYRFLNVPEGDYDLVVEFENSEVARLPIRLVGNPTDFRQDVAMEWKAGPVHKKTVNPGVVSVEDTYDRKAINQSRFEKAQVAIDNKENEKALALLQEVVADDPQDFQAWAELGTVYLAKKDLAQAEASYLRSTSVRPKFFLALLNLGRVRLMQAEYATAITPLEQAVFVRPKSADANYFLGEGYLQIKKGSLAVGYLNEAIKIDPVGMAQAHLRLATLYNAAGMKDKAASEYEQFLTKVPDYKDKKKLQEYISANKKP